MRLGLLVQAMQALAAGLRLAAAHYRARTLQPTPQVRNGTYHRHSSHLPITLRTTRYDDDFKSHSKDSLELLPDPELRTI